MRRCLCVTLHQPSPPLPAWQGGRGGDSWMGRLTTQGTAHTAWGVRAGLGPVSVAMLAGLRARPLCGLGLCPGPSRAPLRDAGSPRRLLHPSVLTLPALLHGALQ